MDELIKVATEAAIGALTKAAAEPALAAGHNVWAWIKGIVSGEDARVLAAVEKDPAKLSATTKVTAILQDALNENPQAVKHLQELLNASGGMEAVTQTANVSGQSNKVGQVSGSGNTVQIN